MAKRRGPRAQTNQADEKRWKVIKRDFILMPESQYKQMSWRDMAKYWDVPKSSLHQRATSPEANGKSWEEQRAEVQRSLVGQSASQAAVDVMVFDTEDSERNDFISKSKKMIYILYDKIISFLDNEDFQINSNIDAKQFLKLFNELSSNYAKLRHYVDTGRTNAPKGDNGPKIILNVPVKYITAEGREWLKRKLENPQAISNAEDAAFTKVEE